MLTTTVIGSFPQPEWLVDREQLKSQRVPRVSQPELWRIDGAFRDAAIEDTVRLAVRDMEDAGIDIVTDGEIGRESYSNHFLGALDGIAFESPAIIKDRRGRDVIVPRVTGPIARTSFVEGPAARFLKSTARHKTKVTLPGAFTLAQQCADEYYNDIEALSFAFAEALNAEAQALADVGIDVVQFDEPWFRNDPESARKYGVKLVNRLVADVNTTTALHMCFGYGFLVAGTKPKSYDFLPELAESDVDQISIEAAQPGLDLTVLKDLSSKTLVLGVLNLGTDEVETVNLVADRIRAGLEFLDPNKLMPAPDCGMKYLSREAAQGKLSVLGKAAAIVRKELT